MPTFAADLRMKVMFWDLVSGYYEVFEKLGYTDGTYDIVDDRMACDIAVFTKH